MSAPLATLLFLALPCLSLMGVSAVGAQTQTAQPPSPSLRIPPQERPTGMRFREMDLNNDGIITRDEWRGSAQSFRVHDWNRDGMLSGDEVRMTARRPGRIEDEDFDPETAGDFWDWTPEGFQRLDRNRDGRISRIEWPFDGEVFWRADRNRDGVLSRAEFMGSDAADDLFDEDRSDRFEYLDVNNNGRIERSEWHGSEDAFRWLDRNNNGVLSRAEVVGTETATPRNQFATLDLNRNNVITPDEWRWSRRSFDERDLNRDGRLTRREFNVTADTAVAPAGAEVVRVDPRAGWIDTGIDLNAGDIVRLRSVGTIQLRTNDPNDVATPAGSRTGRRADRAPYRDSPAGALIAKIGDALHFVGDRTSITATTDGRLYLGVNDDHLADNSGEFRVTITVLGR